MLHVVVAVCVGVTWDVKAGESIQACVDTAAEGDVCSIGEGVWQETVYLGSGVSVIGSGEKTVLEGAVDVQGWALWERGIYVAEVDAAEQIQQVFLDGGYVPEARWPNADFSSMLDVSKWATAKNGTQYGFLYDPAMQATHIDWTGAIATMNLDKRVLSYTRRVENFTGTSFNYTLPLPGEKPRAQFQYINSPYFLKGVMAALDAPTEWFHDVAGKKLYMKPDGAPLGARVTYRAKDYCVEATQEDPSSPPTIANLQMHSCTFMVVNANGAKVSDVNVTYPTYARELLSREPHKGPSPNVTLISGNDTVVERVAIKHTNVAGIEFIGSRNTLRNSLIMDTDWVGSLDFPPVRVGFSDLNCPANPEAGPYPDLSLCSRRYPHIGAAPGLGHVYGEDNVVTGCTVRMFGNSGIVTSQLSIEVSYNHVLEGGLIGCDHAGIHADHLPAPCMYNTSTANCIKEFHHNWAHDLREKCLRGDDSTVNLTVHHSVAWNCGYPKRDDTCGAASAGLVVKGDYNTVYGVTVFNVTNEGMPAQGDLVPLTYPGPPPPGCVTTNGAENECKPMNKHSSFFNIAAHVVNTHAAPLNQSAEYTAAFYQGEPSTYDLADAAAYDFTPTAASPLRGTGVAHPPYTTGTPDIGAVQSSEPKWTPGCTFHPEC